MCAMEGGFVCFSVLLCDQNFKKIWIDNPTSCFMNDASQYGVNVGIRGSNPHFLVMMDHLESRERVLLQVICDGVGPGPVLVSLTGYNDKLSPTGVVVKHHHYSACRAISGLIIGTRHHIHIEHKHHRIYNSVQTRGIASFNTNIRTAMHEDPSGWRVGRRCPSPTV